MMDSEKLSLLPVPEKILQRAIFHVCSSFLKKLNMWSEAISRTSGRGWENLTDLHSQKIAMGFKFSSTRTC